MKKWRVADALKRLLKDNGRAAGVRLGNKWRAAGALPGENEANAHAVGLQEQGKGSMWGVHPT